MRSQPLQNLVYRLHYLAAPDSAGGASDHELVARYVAGDEPAFELLVWRHGAMVLATCRRILGPAVDPTDAFQATFLALVRKAHTIRQGSSVGGWLHQVARRAALRDRSRLARQSRRERPGLPEDVPGRAVEPGAGELAAVLDEEINRLPEKLRSVVVLCHLEGRSNNEAAARLGCPTGTVESRLTRARQFLRHRLTRRGLGAASIALPVAADVVPAELVAATVRAALAFAAGPARRAAVHGPVLALTRGVLRDLLLRKLKPAAGVAAAVLALAVGGGLWTGGRATDVPPSQAPPAAPPDEPPPAVARPDPPAPRVLATAEQGLTRVADVRFSPDGKYVLTVGGRPVEDRAGARVAAWAADTGRHAHTFGEPEGVGAGLDFSPDGTALATANAEDGSVTVWAVGAWTERAALKGHCQVGDVRFGPDGNLLAARTCIDMSGKEVSQLQVWDLGENKTRLQVKSKSAEAFVSMAFSPDGNTLAVGTCTGRVRRWDLTTGRERPALTVSRSGEARAEYSADGRRILTWVWGEPSGKRGTATVQLWDAQTSRVVQTITVKAGPVVQAGLSPDGTRVATLGAGQTVQLWDAATGAEVTAVRLTRTGEATGFAFSPDGKVLAVWGWERETKGKPAVGVSALYSAEGELRVALPGVRRVAFATSGRSVALVTGLKESVPDGQPDGVTVYDWDGLLAGTGAAKE